MKIALILFNLSTEAGAPRFLLSFAQALKKMGHRVVIYTSEYNPGKCFPNLNKGLDIREIKSPAPAASTLGAGTILGKGIQRIQRYRLTNKIARDITAAMDRDFDIVNCHTDFSYRVGFLYKKINQKAKFIWTMHDSPFDFNPKKNFLENMVIKIAYAVEETLEKRFFLKADLAVVLDNRNAEIARGFGLPTEVIRGGVDFNAFYAEPRRRQAGSKDVNLIGVGSLGPYRRFEDIISAVAILRKRGCNAKALLACQDFWSNKAYRQSFEKFIDDSGVAKFIDARFNGIPEKEFAKAYDQSDVYIYPTNLKIWGMAPFEAMTAGLPTIICSASSDVEVIKDGENALLVDPLRPDQIADRVEQLIKSPELYENIARNGQEFVRNNLTWEKYAENFMAKVSAL